MTILHNIDLSLDENNGLDSSLVSTTFISVIRTFYNDIRISHDDPIFGSGGVTHRTVVVETVRDVMVNKGARLIVVDCRSFNCSTLGEFSGLGLD